MIAKADDTALASIHLPYESARGRILDGDILLWRPTSLLGRYIAWRTGGQYSHAAMAGWFGNVLAQLETLQWHGGQATNLSRVVRQYPGQCDVYRLQHPSGFRHAPALAAAVNMFRRTGQPYGWPDLAYVWLQTLCPWIGDDNRHTADWDHSMFCSATVADALRRAGYLVAEPKPVWRVLPGDLAAAGEYQFTIDWE